MSHVFQPVGQIRLTNVAIVRHVVRVKVEPKSAGEKRGFCEKTFELACYPNKVQDYNDGIEKDISEVLQSDHIFSDVRKGLFAKEQDLKLVFGTTDHGTCVKILLKHGHVQLSERERKNQLTEKLNLASQMAASRLFAVSTGSVLTHDMVKSALKDLRWRPKLRLQSEVKNVATQIVRKLCSAYPDNLRQTVMRARIRHPPTLLPPTIIAASGCPSSDSPEVSVPPETGATASATPGKEAIARHQQLINFLTKNDAHIISEESTETTTTLQFFNQYFRDLRALCEELNFELLIINPHDRPVFETEDPGTEKADNRSKTPEAKPQPGPSAALPSLAAGHSGLEGEDEVSDEYLSSSEDELSMEDRNLSGVGDRKKVDYGSLLTEDRDSDESGSEGRGSDVETKAVDEEEVEEEGEKKEEKEEDKEEAKEGEKEGEKEEGEENEHREKQDNEDEEKEVVGDVVTKRSVLDMSHREQADKRRALEKARRARERLHAEKQKENLRREKETTKAALEERQREALESIVVLKRPADAKSWCEPCKHDYLLEGETLKTHMKSGWHLLNVKRQFKGETEPVSRLEYEEIAETVREEYRADW